VDVFVRDQTEHFLKLMKFSNKKVIVVDIGGGIGNFAKNLNKIFQLQTKVIDSDPYSISIAASRGLDALVGDAINPIINGDEDIICFNLVLHHLIGSSEAETSFLQINSLRVWQQTVKNIFVNEYIYESYFNNFSGKLIFIITKNKFLSAICRKIGFFIPSLQANTFGVGVRFRSHDEWVDLFEESGYKVEDFIIGESEFVSLPRRLLFIKSIRRNSYLLAPHKKNNI
jgi:SAM-dependent methyltransferase